MKKLSDYRIKEVNGNFIIETKIEFKTGVFKRKTQIEWVTACPDGSPFVQLNKSPNTIYYYDYFQDNCEIKYKSIDDAKAKIVEWCEKPKYHYVKEIEAYADRCFAKAESEMKGIIDTALAQVKKSFKCFPCDLPDIAKTEQQMKEEITEQDVVGACKKQFDEKLPSFKDCGRKSLCTLSDETYKKYDALFLGNYAKCVSDEKGKLTEEYNVPNTPVEGKHFSADNLKKSREQMILMLENLKDENEKLKDKNERLKNDYDFLYKKHIELFDECIDLKEKVCELKEMLVPKKK